MSLADWLREDGDELVRRSTASMCLETTLATCGATRSSRSGMSARRQSLPLAEQYLDEEDELLREQAEWAVARIRERNAC